MKYVYKKIDVSTKAGHAQAVRLQASGWRIVAGSVFGVVLLEKKK